MATDTGLAGGLDEELENEELPEGQDGESDLEEHSETPLTVEQEARTMGWHPLAEFKGPPSRWTTAEEFVRRGRTELPILRDNNRRMTERLARMEPQIAEIGSLKTTVAEMNQALKDMRVLAHKSTERGYAQALADLKKERREAVESGDVATHDLLDQKIEALQTERAEITAPPAPAVSPPAAEPAALVVEQEIQDFIADNSDWWGVNQRLTQAMVTAHSAVKLRHPKMSLEEQLVEAKRRIATDYGADFPQYFPEPDDEETAAMPAPRTPARTGVAPVQRPSPPRQQQQRADPWLAIADPTERSQAQSAFKNMQRQMPDMTAAEYLILYDNPHADILEIRRQQRAKK